jgi:hypothetical protein
LHHDWADKFDAYDKIGEEPQKVVVDHSAQQKELETAEDN